VNRGYNTLKQYLNITCKRKNKKIKKLPQTNI